MPIETKPAAQAVDKSIRVRAAVDEINARYERDDLIETADRLAVTPLSDKTLSDYYHDWTAWSDWCKERKIEPRPAGPAEVELYLVELYKRGWAISTLARVLAVLRHAHRGMADPTDTPRIRNIWSNMRRERGIAPRRQARAIGLAELRAMVTALRRDQSIRAARDRTMLLVGWCAALRSSELVALNWSDITGAPEGCIVRVRRSKTDQEGRGELVGLPWLPDPEVCAARALCALREIVIDLFIESPTPIADAPVFLGSSFGPGRQKLTLARADKKAVTRAVKRAAAAAQLPSPETFSSHSLRRGLATEGERQGVPSRVMRVHGRWKSIESYERYVESGGLWRSNALTLLFGAAKV